MMKDCFVYFGSSFHIQAVFCGKLSTLKKSLGLSVEYAKYVFENYFRDDDNIWFWGNL